MRCSYFAILFILLGCSKKADFSQIKVIGHAGMGLEMSNSVYHNNSKQAIEYALLMPGCDGVEVDVQLSQDGELWLYHDPYLESETTGSGCVQQKTSDELELLHYKSFYQEKLCRLNELNPIYLQNKKIYLDLKRLNFCESNLILSSTILQALNDISFLKDSNIQVCIITNDISFIHDIHLAGYKTAFELDDISKFNIVKLDFPNLTEIVVKNKFISVSQVVEIQNQGVNVTLFEMRSASGIRSALKKSPYAIITDDLRESIIEVN